jgi:hypothetical protein
MVHFKPRNGETCIALNHRQAGDFTQRPSRQVLFVRHVEPHMRASSHARHIDVAKNERGDDFTAASPWVRAATISRLSWGSVPFDAYGSEQRPTQGFHTRLCNAFRLFRSLDALLHSRPLRPCFIPVTPLGFRFRRFPLPGSQDRLSTFPVLRAVSETTRDHRPGRIAHRTTTRM